MCLHPQRVEKTFDVLAAARCRCWSWAGPTFCFVTSFRPATNRGARACLRLATAHTPTNQWRTGQNSRPAGHSRKSAASAWIGTNNVFVFNRVEHPMIVFDCDGNFLRSFGEG